MTVTSVERSRQYEILDELPGLVPMRNGARLGFSTRICCPTQPWSVVGVEISASIIVTIGLAFEELEGRVVKPGSRVIEDQIEKNSDAVQMEDARRSEAGRAPT